MAEFGPSQPIDLRRGFARAGTALFWLSASVVILLWAAQKASLISLGFWLGPLAFLILFVGFTASGVARVLGVALDLAASSNVAKDGAARVSSAVARMGWLPRLVLSFLPGANLLTIADLLASIRDGSFADGVRSAYQMLGAVLGGGLMGVGAAAAAWQWWHGTDPASLQGWLVIAGIGTALMLLFMLAAGWVAQGFRPTPDTSRPR